MDLPSRLDRARAQLAPAGQLHLLAFYGSLTDAERAKLLRHIEKVDWASMTSVVEEALSQGSATAAAAAEEFKAIPSGACGGRSYTPAEEVARLRAVGLRAVAEGQVGLILMAGGQATRLGVRYPKGLYKVGLPSGKSLYELHAEKALRIQAMAAQLHPDARNSGLVWYVMTSEATQAGTIEFFEQCNYFGLLRENVLFFKQFTFPCVGLDGKVLLADRHRIQSSPDGNGGLYRAFRERGCLEDMRSRGLKCLQIFGVDNILTRVGDPDFLGFCLDKGVEMAAKIVEKTSPTERVGVVTLGGDGRYRVVEYSEISAEDAARADPTFPDRLLLRAGSICQHFVTAEGLAKVCQPAYEAQLKHHAARKRIPYCDLATGRIVDQPAGENGVKLEKFVFDVFPFAAGKFAVWEVPRHAEFSPLKNGPAASSECPKTCRSDLLALHAGWLRDADAPAGAFQQGGASLPPLRAAEVSPLVSYAGEDLAGRDGVWWAERIRSGGVRLLPPNECGDF